MIKKEIIEEKIKEIANRAWFPIELAKVNNQVVRLALFDGEYHWHKHDNEDEFFLVHSGKIAIQLKNQEDIILSTGEFTVIPKGVEHRPKSITPSYILMFEPQETNSTGA